MDNQHNQLIKAQYKAELKRLRDEYKAHNKSQQMAKKELAKMEKTTNRTSFSTKLDKFALRICKNFAEKVVSLEYKINHREAWEMNQLLEGIEKNLTNLEKNEKLSEDEITRVIKFSKALEIIQQKNLDQTSELVSTLKHRSEALITKHNPQLAVAFTQIEEKLQAILTSVPVSIPQEN